MALVYLITNKVNGKQYVGFTTQTVDLRWCRHRSQARTGSSFLLHKAIRKYGEETFSVKTITTGSDAEMLRLETYVISQFETIAPGGYNLRAGGNCARHSDETRRKMSRATKNRPPCSDETRRKMSKSAKKRDRTNLHRSSQKYWDIPENREKQAEIVRQRWQSLEYRNYQSKTSRSCGERHYSAKLTEDDVRTMRATYRQGGTSFAAVGKDFGVSAVAAYNAIRGITWKHLTDGA